jgi:hypothetical protein
MVSTVWVNSGRVLSYRHQAEYPQHGADPLICEVPDKLAARLGHQLIYSVGWELGQREKTAITAVPRDAWQIAVDERGDVRQRRADDA